MLRKLFGPKHTFREALVFLETGLRSGEIALNGECRTDVTYAQLDRVLRSLGFACRLVTREVPARVYEHEQYGPLFTLPPFRDSDRVLDNHLVAVRTMLGANGIADPTAFAAELQKTRNDELLDYTLPPSGPLSPSQAAWVEEQLRHAGRRKSNIDEGLNR